MTKPKLDSATTEVLKRVLALPPKSHEDMKVGRPKKKPGPKAPASSSKRPAS